MPQFLKTSNDPTLDELVNSLLEEHLPELSSKSWSEHLQAQGLNPRSLAQMYVESLTNCKPAARVKEIRELLSSLGITRGPVAQTTVPTVVINGENIQLNQMLLPEREWK